MKIIYRKDLCTFITLRHQKIAKFLCLVLNFQKIMKFLFGLKLSKNYEISLFSLKLSATTVMIWITFFAPCFF